MSAPGETATRRSLYSTTASIASLDVNADDVVDDVGVDDVNDIACDAIGVALRGKTRPAFYNDNCFRDSIRYCYCCLLRYEIETVHQFD